MNTSLKVLLFPVVITFLFGCSSKQPDYTSADKIAINWELLTNFTDQPEVFEARFTITNNSDLSLTGSNWTLFFNMAPRPILPNKEPQPATVRHINGDWYKLVPDESFILGPGESIKINYRGTEAVIKETDRPLGLYITFYDENKKEKELREITSYTWTSFTKQDQINRTPQDKEQIPTAAWQYKTNLDVHELPEQAATVYPSPVKLVTHVGTLELSAQMKIFAPANLEKEAKYLAASLSSLTDQTFEITTSKPDSKSITLQLGDVSVNGISKEAYKLVITEKGVIITGSDAAGVFYGIQSLRSLTPISAHLRKSSSIHVPLALIEDAPRFGFRGLHLDVSRNFQSKETILRLLDLLSFYKINRFLFYTTEDEGFRLEIKDLPELTEVGAQREHTYGKEAPVLHPAYGSGPIANQEGKYGHGFYTRADFIEILKYATDRHIKVIPELNFPGHARAAIKAMEARYERLMKEGKEKEANEYRLIDPNDKSEFLSAQGYTDNVVCVALESVFHFYDKVVDEVTDMYKEAGLTLDEFHTGGDEVAEGAWAKSPLALTLMKEHPEIKDPHNLQTYFFRELVKRLKARNLQIDGWEEVALNKTADGSYEPNPEFSGQRVVPYIWNNMFDRPDLGYKLANAGYKVVLCNVSNFYFDLAYSKDPEEPGLYWAGFVDVRNAWTFAPYDMFKTTTKDNMGRQLDLEGPHRNNDKSRSLVVEKLRPEAYDNILGVEAQVWSETIKGPEMLEYYILPKLIGFAESAWSKERSWEKIESKQERDEAILKGWNTFANNLAKEELPRLSYLNGGYNYRIPGPGAIIEDGILKANVEYPGLEIRYTTDGSAPSKTSTKYSGPVKVKGSVKLKCFDVSGKCSKIVEAIPG